MPVAGSDIDANVFGQKIYVIWNSENLVYDVLNDSWTNTTSMPHPVSAYASAVFQNKIYFFLAFWKFWTTNLRKLYTDL